MTMPAACAIATRWMVWLVDPPVASRPTMPLTIARSSTTFDSGAYSAPNAVIFAARWAAARVSASRNGVFGLTNAAPGRCRPMTSISI